MMKRTLKTFLGVGAAVALLSSAAWSAGFFTNGVPPAGGTQYPLTVPLTGNETVPADTNLTNGQNPASEAITTGQIASLAGGYGIGYRNLLIGGSATINLFQRATTGASQTTTVAYGGPDRWAYWSGTSTAMTVSQDSTASDVPAGEKYSFKMARTSGQTGVVQMCMAQEIESANVYQLQGQTVELDWNAYTGANFSPASPYNMTAYVIWGTGTDEGISKLAYGLNAGGGGGSAWTGQANATAAVVSLGGVSTAGRYAAVATIPLTATEVAVALCYTPTGTAGTNDYVALDSIQLVKNPSVASLVSTTLGYNVANGFPATPFERRPTAVETYLQQRYTYSIAEGTITAGTIMVGGGTALGTTTTCSAFITFPTSMFKAPTYTNALTASTFKLVSASQAATALSTPFSATLGVNTVYGASMNFTTTGMTAKDSCELVSAAGSGLMVFSGEE